MRLLELRLIAFGPFTDLRLDLAARDRMHLVFGLNEAGKSTALRAVRALFYGIPARTGDAHLHRMPELRIGARLVGRDGPPLEVVRRKGLKNTLLDPDGTPVDEARLTTLLGGVSEDLYQSMFGLDAAGLRRGAQALLAGQGGVGESLFDAGLGGRGVHRVLERLRREADELFTPQARTRKLNDCLNRYREASARSRSETRSGDSYRRQEADVQRDHVERSAIDAERRTLRAELSRLERIRRILPLVAERREIVDALGAVAEVARLPPEARDERLEVEGMIARCDEDLAQLEAEIAGLEQRIASLAVPAPLNGLEESVVARLRNDLGSHRKARDDVPRVTGKRQSLEDDAAQILRRLGWSGSLDEASRLRPDPGAQARIRKLALEWAGRIEKRDSAARRVREVELRLHRLAAPAPEVTPADPAPLERALARARRAGDLEARIEGERAAGARLAARLATRLQALGLTAGPAELVAALPVPLGETIARFETAWRDADRTASELLARAQALDRRTRAVAARRRELAHSSDLPTRRALAAERARRDLAIDLITHAYLGAPPDPKTAAQVDPDRPLDQAVRAATRAADDLADRLLNEADRVTLAARIAADEEELTRDAATLREAQVEAERTRARLEQGWRGLWQPCGIEPLTPPEMRAWLGRHAEIVRLVEERDEVRRAASASERALAETSDELHRALAAAGDPEAGPLPLDDRIERAGDRLRYLHEAQRTQAQQARDAAGLDAERTDLARDLEEQLRALDGWRAEWRTQVERIGLAADATPEEAIAVLDELAELLNKKREIEGAQRRIDAMERDAYELRARLADLFARHAPDLATGEPEVQAEQLIERHERARADLDQRNRLEADLAQRRPEAARLREARARASKRLTELMRRARVSTRAALEEAEQRANERRQLEAKLAEVDKRIVQTGEGLPLEGLLAEAAASDPDTCKLRIAEFEAAGEELGRRFTEVAERIGSGQRDLAHFTGSTAADALAEAEVWAAEVRTHARNWVRLHLSHVILEREVERYRERNQDPILRRAGQIFPRLTGDRYIGLRVDFGADDQPMLLTVRAGGERVAIEGLSTGTRDQLYLALRLASLERHLAHNEPMPVVLDDLLIHFDEPRARAALAVLGELAASFQILFFTHSDRLREIARDAIGDRLVEHELRPAPVG